MSFMARSVVALALLGLIVSCGGKDKAAQGKELNIYIWSDYLPDSVVQKFSQETGIAVRVDNYDSNETLEGKLFAGHTGYDLVVPSANFMEKQIKTGVYQKLDKTKLSNLNNMDAEVMQRLQLHDPGNQYAIDYMWGSTGIGYNVAKIKQALSDTHSDAPLDSWRLAFDPEVVKHFAGCGVAMLDSASEITAMTLAYLGKNPNDQTPETLKLVEDALMKIRPHIRYFNSSRYIEDLASGEICLVVGYNGDVIQAKTRAIKNKTGVDIAYVVPKEGSIGWFDSMAIPADAPHADNAHTFINFMMRPENIAEASTAMHYANGNQAATAKVADDVRNDPSVYPPPEVRTKLFPNLAVADDITRLQTRIWTRFTTGQ